MSHTAVQYLVPYSCHIKSIKAQMDNSGLTWTWSGIELRNCSWLFHCWCIVQRYAKSGQSQLAWPDSLSSLLHLVHNTFGMLFVFSVFSHFLIFLFLLLISNQRKQAGEALLDTDIDWFDLTPIVVWSCCGHLSRVNTFCWCQIFKLKI